MKALIRARFDGKVFIPEEPVDLAEGQTVTLILLEEVPRAQGRSVEERLAAFDRFTQRGVRGVILPPEALSRASIYEE